MMRALSVFFFFLMIRRPPRSTRTDTLFPYTTLFRSFEQCAGFLRVSGGDNPLDASAVHPEAYPVVERIIAQCGREVRNIIGDSGRSEEHTSELQSLMRISYAVFCLKKKHTTANNC